MKATINNMQKAFFVEKTNMSYKLDKKILNKDLIDSLNNLSNKLINIFSLKYKKEVETLNSPLLRWLDFRNRYVDPKPRRIVHSDKFPKLHLPAPTLSALRKLENAFITGLDVNPYQGRGLIFRNDTSGKNSQTRTDLLFADWNILHFHLTNESIKKDRYFSQPADFLIFCFVENDIVAFIDILPHPDKAGFSEPFLIETAYRNWPNYFEHFKFNRELQGNTRISKDEINHFRTLHVNYPLSFDGKSHVKSGLGISTAGTSLKVQMMMIHIHSYVESLTEMICDETGQFSKEISSLGTSDPKFNFEISERGLVVYETITKIAFVLPKVGNTPDFLATLSHLILPDWATHRYFTTMKT